MKLALSVWNGRIAPVLDASERCLIVDTEEDTGGSLASFPGRSGEEKARYLCETGVTTLVCGAISHEYERIFLAYGIEMITFISGPTEQVLEAWKVGTLIRMAFSMPGCGCPRRRRCRFMNKKENTRL